jgi:hypothetical protein
VDLNGERTGGEPSDGGIAMLFSLVLITLLSTFMLVSLSQITSEVRQTQFARKHEQTLNSAMAGINAGLNQIRASANAVTGAGLVARLPCVAGQAYGQISGTLGAVASASGAEATWSSTVYYLAADPATMTPAQVVAAALPCPLSVVPKFAYIVSAGAQPAYPGSSAALGNRNLRATYTFATSNKTSIGGQIGYNGRCWDVGSAPSVGSAVTFQNCNGGLSQSWYYRPDLTIKWMGNPSANLCLDRTSTGPLSGTNYVMLKTCLGSGVLGTAYDQATAKYVPAGLQYQEFPTQDSWSVANASGGRDDWLCITSYTPGSGIFSAATAGDRLVVAAVADCWANVIGAGRATSSSQVGAGAAAGITNGLPGPTQQIVNLKYANHCFDVMNGWTWLTNPLIHYTCGQSPNYALIPGNKRFGFVPVSGSQGQILTYSWSTPQCFESAGTYLNTVSCVNGRVEQLWTMTGVIAGDYENSYTIRDYRGYCLTADFPTQRFGALGTTSLKTCTGDDDQKWNAPPNATDGRLRGLGES